MSGGARPAGLAPSAFSRRKTFEFTITEVSRPTTEIEHERTPPAERGYPFSVRTAALQAAAGDVRPKAFAERTETLRTELKSSEWPGLSELQWDSLLECESGSCCGLKAAGPAAKQ